jgi:hypothetical protein
MREMKRGGMGVCGNKKMRENSRRAVAVLHVQWVQLFFHCKKCRTQERRIHAGFFLVDLVLVLCIKCHRGTTTTLA